MNRREELLGQLQQVAFCATPTVMTYDMGLQYDYISTKGAGTGLGNILSWPAYKINIINDAQWKRIQDKIKNASLSMEDLVDTDLQQLAERFMQATNLVYDSFSDLFLDLVEFPGHLSKPFYCLFDYVPWEHYPSFYYEEDELLASFEDKYCDGAVAWETMSTEELDDWLSRSQDDLSEFPYNTLQDEIE